MTFDRAQLIRELTRDEGVRTHLYLDSLGHESIGIGRDMSNGLRGSEIDLMLENDIADAEASLDRHLAWWRDLDPVRQRVLLNLCFNMGWPRLSQFVKFLAATKQQQWEDAANELVNSRWHHQVGERAIRLEHMMRTGMIGE